MTTDVTTAKIARLNDEFRRSLRQFYLTMGVAALPQDCLQSLLRNVAAFDAFTADNDPYKEHDFGAIDLDGERFFWKIDYYDESMSCHSPDPCDPTVTRRVLTIMLASEY